MIVYFIMHDINEIDAIAIGKETIVRWNLTIA